MCCFESISYGASKIVSSFEKLSSLVMSLGSFVDVFSKCATAGIKTEAEFGKDG